MHNGWRPKHVFSAGFILLLTSRQRINGGNWRTLKFSWFGWTQMSALEYKTDQNHSSVFHIFRLPTSIIISPGDRIRTLWSVSCLTKIHFQKSRLIPPLTCLYTRACIFFLYLGAHIYFSIRFVSFFQVVADGTNKMDFRTLEEASKNLVKINGLFQPLLINCAVNCLICSYTRLLMNQDDSVLFTLISGYTKPYFAWLEHPRLAL